MTSELISQKQPDPMQAGTREPISRLAPSLQPLTDLEDPMHAGTKGPISQLAPSLQPPTDLEVTFGLSEIVLPQNGKCFFETQNLQNEAGRGRRRQRLRFCQK